MATHDYVIDNSTGANVRADINNVLQAILTNNSSSSAPSTTAAYMWWADTTNGVLKIRNSSNNDWVELLQLDGTLTLEDGSASTPALSFRDDLNTGVYSSAADTFNVATGGVERMELGATTVFNEDGADVDFRIEGDSKVNLFYLNAGTDRIGINEDAPSALFHVAGTDGQTVGTISSSLPLLVSKNGNCGVAIIGASNAKSIIALGDPDDADVGMIEYDHSSNNMIFTTSASESMRIDSAGDLLIGHSSSVTASGNDNRVQIHGGNFADSTLFIGRYANGSSGACLSLGMSRNGTVGSQTIVQDGDEVGKIRFYGSDGNNFDNFCAEIRAQIDGTPGSDDMPGRLVFQTTADGAASPTERMRIDSSGRVGIGTTSPSTKLHITGDVTITKASDTAKLSLISTGGSGQQFDIRSINSNGRFAIGTTSNNHVLFESSNNNVLIADNAGNVGIGTTSPAVKLDVVGGIRQVNTATSNTDSQLHFDNDTSGGAYRVRFDSNGSIVGSIQVNTSSTAYNTSSDYRLKENAVSISDGITRLKTLKPYRFNFKSDTSTIVDGFFAHEVTAVPEAITGTKDEVATEDSREAKKGDPIYQQIDQAKLVPLLVAAVQELITKVETLEAA